jgi:hypothetical protein
MFFVVSVAEAQPIRGYIRATGALAMKYLDEPGEFARGASVRIYLPRRFSLEPEVMASRGLRFNQWTLIPNIAFDLRDPAARAVPYLIGGLGYFHELDKSIRYERSELAWSAGIGTRIRLRGGLFAAPEFRVGHLTRVSISLGYLF